MRKVIASLLLSLLVVSPALAQTAQFRCLPVKEAAGKGAVALLTDKLVAQLVAAGWKDPVVKVRTFKMEKASDVTANLVKADYFTNATFSGAKGATEISFKADLGNELDLRCKVKLARVKAVLVSASYTKTTDGKEETVKVSKLPIKLEGMTVQGLLVPSAPAAAAAH